MDRSKPIIQTMRALRDFKGMYCDEALRRIFPDLLPALRYHLSEKLQGYCSGMHVTVERLMEFYGFLDSKLSALFETWIYSY